VELFGALRVVEGVAGADGCADALCMCVYICTCVCVYIYIMCVCVCVYIYNVCVCVCVCVFVCVYHRSYTRLPKSKNTRILKATREVVLPKQKKNIPKKGGKKYLT
jgi:hypothetical protein